MRRDAVEKFVPGQNTDCRAAGMLCDMNERLDADHHRDGEKRDDEGLSTVHWVAREGASSKTIVAQTRAWNDRKKQFTPRQIAVAFDVLRLKGWLVA